MSETFIKVQRKGQMVMPRRVREMTGLAEGTLMKVDVLEGPRYLLTPQVTIDRSIVTTPQKNRKEVLKQLAAAVAELRQDAKDKHIDKMSKAEINAAVAAARRDLKKTSKRPAK